MGIDEDILHHSYSSYSYIVGIQLLIDIEGNSLHTLYNYDHPQSIDLDTQNHNHHYDQGNNHQSISDILDHYIPSNQSDNQHMNHYFNIFQHHID